MREWADATESTTIGLPIHFGLEVIARSALTRLDLLTAYDPGTTASINALLGGLEEDVGTLRIG